MIIMNTPNNVAEPQPATVANKVIDKQHTAKATQPSNVVLERHTSVPLEQPKQTEAKPHYKRSIAL